MTLKVPAPAKINLFLHVTGRRADGYHLLESVFILVDLSDTIELAVRTDGEIIRSGDVEGVPVGTDLCLRAAMLLRERSGTPLGVTCGLQKRIPVGGGMGGGSSDAATTLLALNRLWNLNWDRAALLTLAQELGADVPFFIFGEGAFVRGIGERLNAVTMARQWFIVLMPKIVVSTAAIFAAPELTRENESARIRVFSEGYGRNDLEAVAVARFPRIGACLQALSRAGANPRMTGSGSCVFAAYADKYQAESALEAALSHAPEGVTGTVTRSLARHPLWQFASPRGKTIS